MIVDIIITLVLLAILAKTLNLVYIIFGRIKNSRKVSNELARFVSEKRYLSILISFTITSIAVAIMKNEKSSLLYVFNLGIPEKRVYYLFIYGIMLYTFDFILSIFIRPILYNEGILYNNGSLISWDDVQTINFDNNKQNYKAILVLTRSKKIIRLVVKSEVSDEVKEIIFNKSGVISKGIVT